MFALLPSSFSNVMSYHFDVYINVSIYTSHLSTAYILHTFVYYFTLLPHCPIVLSFDYDHLLSSLSPPHDSVAVSWRCPPAGSPSLPRGPPSGSRGTATPGRAARRPPAAASSVLGRVHPPEARLAPQRVVARSEAGTLAARRFGTQRTQRTGLFIHPSVGEGIFGFLFLLLLNTQTGKGSERLLN